MLCQLGYTTGLFLVTPLGDALEKRRLVTVLLVLCGLALLCTASAPSFFLLLVSSYFVGITAVVVQILIPFVAVLSHPSERSKNLGLVLSGALIGILLSRTFSGFLGAHFGWRASYWAGSALMFGQAAILARMLPSHQSSTRCRYHQLLHSMWKLTRDTPELRRVAANGALMYASLSAFWATLAFYLQSPTYHLGPEVVGLFGLVGAGGAMMAPIMGRYVDRLGPRWVVQMCIVCMVLAWLVLALAGSWMIGLVLGVILLDLGAQSATVSNQTQIYRFHPEAQTRINTIYKMFYFTGGAIGTELAAAAWQHFGWIGVCLLGVLLLAGARAVLITQPARRPVSSEKKTSLRVA